MNFKDFAKEHADDKVDIVTVFVNDTITAQADTLLSEHLIEYDNLEVVDHEIDYDTDNGIVYLDIYCR